VLTGGGLVGKVIKVDDHYAELEIAQNVKVKAVKSTLADVVAHRPPAANADRATIDLRSPSCSTFPSGSGLWLWLLTLVCVLAAMPSLASRFNVHGPLLPDPMVNLGLDLAGGSHILLEAIPTRCARQRLENMEESGARPPAQCRTAHPHRRYLHQGRQPQTFTVRGPGQVDAAREVLPLTTARADRPARLGRSKVIDGTDRADPDQAAGIDQAVRAWRWIRRPKCSQAHRRTGHARADDHPPGRAAHRGAGAGPQTIRLR
jgi:hypothetical protein